MAKKATEEKMNMKVGKEVTVEVEFIDEILGTLPSDKEIYSTYIASKNPIPEEAQKEVDAIVDVDEEEKKQMTVFPRDEKDRPFAWAYQWRGFFKEACQHCRSIEGTLSSKVKAYKKKIDGTIFIKEDKIPFEFTGEMGKCQRSLRASTPQGERISLANSETIPAGAKSTFTIQCLSASDVDLVKEWLAYGILHGTGQWRNSGKGRFKTKILEVKDWDFFNIA